MEYFFTVGVLVLLVACYPALSTCREYIGCFPTTSDVMRNKTTDALMTASMCSRKCAKFNYTVYGLMYGNRCHCGMITDVINITCDMEPASQCNTLCSGVDRCGANKHMAVYKDNQYKGCYDYSGQHSTFNPINDLTLEVCADECRNSTFWSVLHGNKCSCRSQIPPDSTRKDDKHCKEIGEKCTGGEKCGGSGYIDLYVNIAYHDPTVTICPERSQSTVQPRHTEELSDSHIVVTTVTGISAFILGCLAVIGVQCVLRIFQRRKLLKQDRQKTSDNTPGMMISFVNDSLSNETSMADFIKDTPPQPREYTRVIDNMESGQLLPPMSEYARAIENLEIGQFPHVAHTSNQNKLHTMNDWGKCTNETYEIVEAALPEPQSVKNIKRF